MANGQDFVRQLRRDTEPSMRRVTEHVFVRDAINGLLPREALVRFAVQSTITSVASTITSPCASCRRPIWT